MNASLMHHPTEGPHPYSEKGGLARYFVEHREVGWLALVAVLIWGFLSYRMLPQQEDPVLPGRIARVVCVLPGATAARVEQLVTRPVEKKIAELETIEEMSSETREGVVIVTLGQRSASLARTEQEWDKLRAKLTEVALPEGAWAPQLQTDFGDVTTLLLGITGAAEGDHRSLEIAADRLEDELKQLPSVGRTRKLGVVSETVHLLFSPERLNQHGLSLFRIVEALKQRNQLVPTGTFHAGTEDLSVQLFGEFRNEADLRSAIVGAKQDGQPIRLGDVVEVRRGYEEPLPFHIEVFERRNSTLQRSPSVLLAVEMKSGQVISEFSRTVRTAIDRVQPQLAEKLHIVTVSDQPKSVERRLDQFDKCFAEAVLVVILVSLLLMEWRAALIVAFAIPLTIAMTLGGMVLAGIPLHQISIAALIIALGMLVDDPVVAADGINRELAQGRPPATAAWLGPFKLRRAILFATLINIFAFLPLVLLPGDKKSFIYALPVVVTISLIASRIVSMTFIPLLGYYVLRGQRGFDRGGWLARLYRPVLEDALRRPWIAALLAYGLFAASLTLAPRLGRQFFPPAERHQLLVDIALPESASLIRTHEVCGDVFRLLESHKEIETGAIFIGGSGPRFYYNVTPKAPADHLAQVLINTHTADEVPALAAKLRDELDRKIPGARCVVKRLEQGPPVDTPIQIRLTGGSLETLRSLAAQVSTALRDARAYHVHDDLGSPTPTLDLTVDQDRATALGVVTPAVGAIVRSAFAGLKLTELREGNHLVPVMLRLQPEESDTEDKIRDIKVESLSGSLVPLGKFADVERRTAFATIPHFGQRRAVAVKAYSMLGELSAEALDRARPAIDRIAFPAGYTIEYAGEAKELTQSRDEMSRVMAVSLALIALTMVIQFNSLAKSLAVMLTVPLGLIGALIGLTLFHAPLGFMAMLAVVSLAGVIVSHIIVLADAIEEGRTEGLALRSALIRAGLVRMRPVLVTVLATAGGLVPLALKGGELWRPLTAVHICGLLIAAVLTLFVLPVFYYLFIRRTEESAR